MQKNKVSVSFSQKHLDVFNYLKSKDNISSYICRLIEADMNNGQDSLDLESKVRKIINEILNDKQIIDTSSTPNKPVDKESAITDEDIDTILNLF